MNIHINTSLAHIYTHKRTHTNTTAELFDFHDLIAVQDSIVVAPFCVSSHSYYAVDAILKY